ncbi:MAG: 2'-5' RNA ligase family protein [bacterium]
MSLIAISYPRLEKHDFDCIQSIRAEYEPNFDLLDPHVTFVFETDDVEQSLFLEHLRPLITATPAIDFVMRSVSLVKDVGRERWFLLLIPDEGFSFMVRLHDRLYTGVLTPQLRIDIPFIPHITLGVFAEWMRGAGVRDELNAKSLAISGQLTSILIADYRTNELRPILEVPLAT